jgi:hypothetical protein
MVCQRTRDVSNLSYALDTLAAVELQTGGRERVAALLGAAEVQREAVGSTAYRWCGPDIELRQRNATAARERLGHEAYQRAFDAGYSLTLDGAVELARQQVPTTQGFDRGGSAPLAADPVGDQAGSAAWRGSCVPELSACRWRSTVQAIQAPLTARSAAPIG